RRSRTLPGSTRQSTSDTSDTSSLSVHAAYRAATARAAVPQHRAEYRVRLSPVRQNKGRFSIPFRNSEAKGRYSLATVSTSGEEPIAFAKICGLLARESRPLLRRSQGLTALHRDHKNGATQNGSRHFFIALALGDAARRVSSRRPPPLAPQPGSPQVRELAAPARTKPAR